ncbi:DUF6049 family protein [Microbacterium gallinarum]|uniref:2-oxoglutarate dehydrogenase n=1 Tax=Microbacterium gallinarum TaxID=2762209 RepID=A0ABR8X1L4_9MICO|nr:DUF6049 family protein [Microbacterium gallinarum]MBD8023022.1 hypothetical protein [Microbacterium gallinarum]
MTVIPSGRPARRRVPRAATVVVAILTALALLTPTGAVADTPTPSPTPAPPIPAGTTAFTLAPISNGVVRPGDPLVVSLTLQNETLTPTAPVTATLALGRAPLAGRTALTAWLDGEEAGVTTQAVATAAMESVPSGSSRVAAARVEADDPLLSGLAPGVYPLRASYDTPSGTVTSTSAMVVPPTDGDEVGIGVVVPIAADPIAQGLLTADQLTELTAPGGALTAQLDGVEGTAAILAVDPAIPAAIRVLGSSAPETATAWLERLEDLPNSRFALQFGDADVVPQIESGLARPLAPTSLRAYMQPADFVPEPESDSDSDSAPPAQATPTPTPTEAVDPEAPVYPTLPELLDIGAGSRTAVYWPVSGTAGPAVVDSLGDIRIDDQASLTLLSSASTAVGSAGGTVPAHGRAGDAELLVYDADVSDALAVASGLEEPPLRGAALAEATAYLAFATAESGGAPLLVSLGRNPDRSRVALGTTIGAATSAPDVTPFTLGGLANSAVSEVEIEDAPEETVRVDVASALLQDEGELARFATILDDTSLLTGPQRAEILQLLGTGWLADDAGWTAAVADHRAATEATLDSVGLVPTSEINLFGSNVGLRFWVRNDLPYPVNLVLYVTPDNLRLNVQRANPLVAAAGSNSRVEVPVEARVGNGEVTLELQLRSRASVAIGDPESVDVNVRAEWESFGLAALGVVVGGLLLLGVVRTVLRLRARRRGADAASDGTDREASVDGEVESGDAGPDRDTEKTS